MLASERSEIDGVLGGDARAGTHLAAVGRTIVHCLRERSSTLPLLGDMPALLRYLRFDMGHRRVETVRVLFLDNGWRLLREETMWQGTTNAVPLYVREVLRRALELSATSLVLAHNHPSGDVRPSGEDVRRTAALARAAATVHIELHDHLIVGAHDAFSMRRAGMIHA